MRTADRCEFNNEYIVYWPSGFPTRWSKVTSLRARAGDYFKEMIFVSSLCLLGVFQTDDGKIRLTTKKLQTRHVFTSLNYASGGHFEK